MKGGDYRIGVDGGATKTELILVDADGAVIARHVAAGTNPSVVGPERARAILHDSLGALLAESTFSQVESPVSHCLLCMAGNRGFWTETAALLKTYGAVTVRNDMEPVLELATGRAAGLAIHSGTGSFVAARTIDGHSHYAGGLGWRFGDPGSATDIGRRGIAGALFELQGWAEASALARALQDAARLDDPVAISRSFYEASDANDRIAAFAQPTIELAAQGCAPAQRALVASLDGLVSQAQAVSRRLFPDATVPCGVTGSLLNGPAAKEALRSLAAARQWNAELRFIPEPPIEGVRRMLLALR